ncbi:methyl-accepting chemotaxis protein [Bacillus sp. 31A1R]|uniref:Methyl-accepting chemotaxis protein n=1 Tax=Robertmurraya mangrovi TaxID=3098077 RepID=A0ABU5J3W1_9BACI|nr:methyl-accepting chemotaxis protein [Bacillus sp. 31A1R]MDZ5474087.1 methyl-accepting chemotaxis protein [Bacillus sp. 31A1R]
MRKNLFAQIIGITITLIVLVSLVLGGASYLFAERELVNSGKLNLMHIADGAIPVLEELNDEVVSGSITLEEAKEKARVRLNGPAVSGNEKLFYDFTQSPYTYKENGYIFAYDKDLKVQLHPVLPLGQDMSQVKDKKGNFIVKDLYEISKKGDPSQRYYEFAWPKAGETKMSNKISYTVYFEPWDWAIIIGAYEDEFHTSINTLKILILVISFSTVMLATLLMFLLLRKKLLALKTVTTSIIEVANGNLKNETIHYKSSDEVGQIAKAFNKMSEELRELVGRIQTVGHQTSQSSLELSALAEQTTASSEEIGRAMDEITKGAVSQAGDIEDVNAGTESLAHTMKDLNSQNQQIIKLTQESTNAVSNGRNQVSSLQKANLDSKNSLKTIEHTVEELSGQVRDISGIVSTIGEIANQTNLLALNASIEAARAGEHGKGFAVVASEVRKLAEATNKATDEIQQMIQAIEHQTKDSVAEMNTTMALSEQLDHAVTDTEKEFSNLSSIIQEIIHAINRSSEYINNVDNSIQHLYTGIQNVSAVSEQTSASSEEVMSSVEEQIAAILTISRQAETLTQQSEQLNELIKKFEV